MSDTKDLVQATYALVSGGFPACGRAAETIEALQAERDELLYFAKRCAEQLFPSVDDTRQTQRIAHDLRRHACTAISAAMKGQPK